MFPPMPPQANKQERKLIKLYKSLKFSFTLKFNSDNSEVTLGVEKLVPMIFTELPSGAIALTKPLPLTVATEL